MKFTKMHGIGNDYIYVNCFCENVDNPEKTAQQLSDRHFGIGGDGLVLIMPSEKADFRMRMFNADGSEGRMCGNASRCIAKYVYDNRMTDKTEITLETLSGIKKLRLFLKGNLVDTVEVDMGEPILKPSEIPMFCNDDMFVNKMINVNGVNCLVTAVSMGNPHAVVFTSDVDLLELEKTGPFFENHPIFPERVNTEFCQITGENKLKMRVWERGSGETLACGTGACAAVVAAVLNGHCERGESVTVRLNGGNLKIIYADDGHVYMSGSATKVFDGEIIL